nr:MAG TPA: hypothetical protein [Caudoviricetes sp.]
MSLHTKWQYAVRAGPNHCKRLLLLGSEKSSKRCESAAERKKS